MVRSSLVVLKHAYRDTGDKIAWGDAIKRWIPCGDIDRMLKIPHLANDGFRTTSETCLYDSCQIGLQYY